jgi:hypothetical protein
MLNRLRRWFPLFDLVMEWWDWWREPMRLRVGDVVRLDGEKAVVTRVGHRQWVAVMERHDAE